VTKLKGEKKYEKVGAVGYCFGGAMCIRLGSTDLFDSIVIAHPGRSNIEQVRAIKVNVIESRSIRHYLLRLFSIGPSFVGVCGRRHVIWTAVPQGM
jgi:hypothetical protein